MEDPRKEILNRVAKGEITPEEGAALLDDLAAGRTTMAVAPPPPGRAATRIKVRRALGSIVIEGDPAVREAAVQGRHSVRRDGETLVIEGDDMTGEFAFLWAGRSQIRVGKPEYAHPLLVKVNPDLPLEVESQAGTVRVDGVRGPIKASVQAGTARLDGFEGPLDLEVQAGSIRGEGRLASGHSRVRGEAGSIRLKLKDSSVRISGKSALGTIQVDGGSFDNGTWVIGSGEATLDVESTISSVRVDAR